MTRCVLDPLLKVFSYLLHVRIILFVVHAIAHLFALTSMKYTKDCAFYFWPLLFSLLENSTRYLGICQTGQHLMNTHFLVVKAVREALIKQCLPDADQNLEGDDTSSWLFIDYETGKHDSTIEEFKPIKLEVTTIKVSEKTISMTDTTKLKRAAAAESTTLETLNLDEISFQNADVNATEERLMEMEVNCFHNYEERYTRRNYFVEETHKEEKLLLKETKNEETTENVSLILDETNTQVVPNETGRPSLLCTNDLENSSKAKEIHAIGDHLQSTVEEPNTLENTQSDKVCYTAKQEGMKEFNPRNKNDDHEMSGSTCATSFPSGSTYRANGSDLSIESKSNVDQVACSEYELQELKDVRVSNVLHPSMHVSDLKQTHFAGGACKEEAFIESKIPSLDAIQKESLLAHDFSCDNDECICKNADFFANEGTFENKRNSGLDIELTCDDKSTKLKETMIIDEVINEGNTNIELKETIVVEEVTYGDDENTELKGTVIVDKDTYGDTKNTEAKGMINVTEMTFEDKNKNTEPKEIIFVDGVTNEDDRNTELDVSVFVNEVTYEYDTNIEVQETIFAGEDTYVDNEDTGVKEAIFVDKGNCEDVQNTEVKEIILVDGVTYEGKIEGVTYEDNRNTEPQEDIFFVWVSNEDDENTELDKSVFVDEVTCEDNQNTEIQEKGYDGSHEENNMTETIEKYIVNELVSENNTSIPKIEVLLSCEVKPESKNIKQTNAYPIEGVIRKDEDTRQTESFTVNEVTCNFKDLRKIDTFLVDDVTNEHDIVMGQKGTCIACKESNGRKESSSTDVLACAGNKVSGRSEQIYEGEVTCKDENVSCSEDIIFTEDDTSKGIYSWEEKSFLAGKAFNECDQDLGLKMKSHQTPEKAQVSLKCNQHFTKNGPVITGDVSYERGDKKPQVMLLVDKIACNDSQLPNQNASLTSTVTCEEISVLKEHSSPIKTYFPYRQSLDKKLEFIQYSENKETATEAFYAKPLCQSKEQKEILATNTEVPVSETSNLEENYIELNKTPSIDKEVCECIEDLQLRGDSTEIGPLDRLCLQRFMCHLEEFSFSADVWGAHPLSASSYVTCLGIVVTYLLMVLQLQPILSDDTGEKDLDNLLDDQGIFQCFSK